MKLFYGFTLSIHLARPFQPMTSSLSPLIEMQQAALEFPEVNQEIGTQCLMNDDCGQSTFCCSKGRCVPGSICYTGRKQAFDHCEYGFECLSRCCWTGACSDVIRCVETCSTNADCPSEPCCSFGYCTGSMAICTNGMKEDFDICDSGSECKSDECHNNRCSSNIGPVKNHLSYIGAGVILVMLFTITFASCWFSKRRQTTTGGPNDYFRRAKRTEDGQQDVKRLDRDRSGSRERTNSDQYFTKRDKGEKKKRKASDIKLKTERQNTFSHHQHTISKESLERLERENNVKRIHRQSIRTHDSLSPKNLLTNSGRSKKPPALLFVNDDGNPSGTNETYDGSPKNN